MMNKEEALSQNNSTKTSTGLEPNTAGLLCYLGLWITGIIFYIIEKNNMQVRFHAMQSMVVFGIITIAEIIFSWIPFLGWIISSLLGVLTFILWIVLMYSAYKNQKIKIPVATELAEKWTKPAGK
jgi:uncharacterized membrane protein